jgi:hypothetical protein
MPDGESGAATQRQQIGDQLLKVVRDCAAEYHAADEATRPSARERYIRALKYFNDYVLYGKLPVR